MTPEAKAALFDYLAERGRSGAKTTRRDIDRALRRAGFDERRNAASLSALLREWEGLGALTVEDVEIVSTLRVYRLQA